mgnify:CR=1 FL=1
MAERVYPDTVSTDWGQPARTDQVFNFANVLSEIPAGRHAARPCDRVRARSTPRRRCRRSRDSATLAVGAPADVAILELRQGSFELRRQLQGEAAGTQRLFATHSVFGGKG